MSGTGTWPLPDPANSAAVVSEIAAQSEAYWAALDASAALTAAQRFDAYQQAKVAYVAAHRAEREGTGSNAAVKEATETLRLAFAGWTTAPDDGTVTPGQIRDARAAGAAKRSRDLREAGRR